MEVEDFYGSDDMAKKVCPGCPVEKQCLEFALENGEFGVWGGTSERRRRTIKRHRKQAAS
jgi:WhiB family redox-sensing transcriptional regulator